MAVLIRNHTRGGAAARWIASPTTRAESTRESIIARRLGPL
ncbi:hypothetical protein H4W33_002409 [Kibdelosporangium phytohabitans]|nr:hypothetical protein [Kibdelosporangium phytohabitans]